MRTDSGRGGQRTDSLPPPGRATPTSLASATAFPPTAEPPSRSRSRGLLESLATDRTAIETALERIELTGTDPFLAIDRLCADPTVEPAIDLERRRHQLEQLR